MNKELLIKVRDAIQKEPDKFCMDHFIDIPKNTCIEDYSINDLKHLDTTCGTTACIAGWTVHLATKEEIKKAREILKKTFSISNDNEGIESIATVLLDIPTANLFYLSKWPRSILPEFVNGEVAAAVARINLLLETGE